MRDWAAYTLLGDRNTRMLLIAIQLAVTVAVFANVLAIALPRLDKATRSTGMREENAFILASVGIEPRFQAHTVVEEDLLLIRHTPGVLSVTPAPGPPLTGLGLSADITRQPGETVTVKAFLYPVDEQGVESFGVTLRAGRNFRRDEVIKDAGLGNARWPAVIATEPLTTALFGTENPIGKHIFIGAMQPTTIVGVIDRLEGPDPGTPLPWRQYALLVPQISVLGRESRYVVRLAPEAHGSTIHAVASRLAQSNRERIIQDVISLRYLRMRAYAAEIAIVSGLMALVALLLSINAVGIYGMITFWMTTQATEVAVRRAVGAKRSRVVKDLLVQVLGVGLLGSLAGELAAFPLNVLLMQQVEVQALPFSLATLAACAAIGWMLVIAIWPVVRMSALPVATILRRA